MAEIGTEWETVARTSEIPSGGSKRVLVGGELVALFNADGTYYAIGDVCSHDEASLAAGELDDAIVECPRHGARFDLKTGRPKSLPAVVPVPVYRVKVEGDEIKVTARRA